MKKQLAITVLIIVIAAAVVGSVIWKVTRLKPVEETIRIGTVLPLSGPIAFLGEGTLNGLKLAEEHANAGEWGDLSFKIEVVAEDGAGVPRNSIGAYQKLLSTEGARTIITTLSGVCMAIRPLAERDGVLLFANASHPELTAEDGTTLRHSNVASQEAEVILKSMIETTMPVSVAVVVQNDDYGVAFASVVEQQLVTANVDLTASIAYNQEGFDARVIAQQAMAQQPDAVMLVGVGNNLGLLIRRLRELGFTGDIYASLGFVLVPGAVEAAGEYAEGVMHTVFVFDENESAYINVATEYRERFGNELGSEALIAYNTLYLFCETAKNVPSLEPDAMARYIRGLGTFQAPGEEMAITPDGSILPQLQVIRFTSP